MSLSPCWENPRDSVGNVHPLASSAEPEIDIHRISSVGCLSFLGPQLGRIDIAKVQWGTSVMNSTEPGHNGSSDIGQHWD